MMTVMVLNCTLSPIEIISFAAGTSTGRNEAAYNGEKTFAAEHEARKRRVKNCFDKGHMSVFEFAHMSFYISGISRACANQLVRHRLCSFCQESQRYTKIDTTKDDWYIIPERLRSKDHISRLYLNEVRRAGEVYNELIANDVPFEDARYVLPEATKTNITMGCNLRNLYHFLSLREDMHAQWEIRNLARCMRVSISSENKSWAWLLDLLKMYE